MLVSNKIEIITGLIKNYKNITFRIINNTLGKNLILLSERNNDLIDKLQAPELNSSIQEIIIESEDDSFIINEIKNICPENEIRHRNVSYIDWNRESRFEAIENVIAGYSFKGGMGRSSTLAYLAYFYYLTGKKIVVLDCDFEAPGIASMFFNKSERAIKAGILDYLIDLNIEEEPRLDDYFLQSEVSDNSGNLYLFPSGINFDVNNYINKISKIDFNSKSYTSNFTKLLKHINTTLKPDLIFIDLRAGINESNGLVLNQLSNKNLLFFNNEEQNQDGLNVVLNRMDNLNKNLVMNSTIRFSNSEVRALKEKQLNSFLSNNFKALKKDNIIPIPFNSVMLENKISEFKSFITTEVDVFNANGSIYLSELIERFNLEFPFKEDNIQSSLKSIDDIDLANIMTRLKDIFSRLTGTEQFKCEDDSKYFYLKEDLSKIVNEQIFLILGAKGSGKSTLFEMFTKPHKEILSKLNTKNNSYIAGFSKDIMADITQDNFSLIYEKSNNNRSIIKRFWKCLTLFQLTKHLGLEEKYFKSLDEVYSKYNQVEVGIDVDSLLKKLNIDLIENDRTMTIVYDELDIGFPDDDTKKAFITTLVSFWQDNIYKYSQIRSKILLRNDIFNILEIENKTHLDLNKYELKWNEKEILSLILKIFISALTFDELDKIGLSNIIKKKNSNKNEVIDDIDEIIEAIYLIFDRKLSENRPPMDKWIMTRLSDARGLLTPRVIYKFMNESISRELTINTRPERKHLLTSFAKNNTDILTDVGKHKLEEYKAEFPKNIEIYEKLKAIGQRTFSFDDFKSQYKRSNKVKNEVIKKDLERLVESGFIIYEERTKKYQVAYIYVYALGLKLNRSNTKKQPNK